VTVARGGTAPLRLLAAESQTCTRCDLYARATQTVFGQGPVRASLFLVGEQPGDREDLEGQPFVGPAGGVLDAALRAADIERAEVYVTNAVKHFKWTPRGKRRIHQRPNRTEVLACRVWLERELALIDPAVVVALGATAGQALWGGSFRLGASRSKALEFDGRAAYATIHPSAVLRTTPGVERSAAFDGLVDDLRRAWDRAQPHVSEPGGRGTATGMDAITLLKQDHKAVKQLFRQFESLGDNATSTKEKVVADIVRELTIHASIEETVFYPAVKGISDELRDHVLESLEEHHVVKWLCSELDGMDPEDERFDAKTTVLIENVRHHVQEEEGEFFPDVRRALGRKVLREIGDLLAEAKRTAPTHPHPKASDEPPTNVLSSTLDGLIDRARDEIAAKAGATRKRLTRTG
jgi:DNA polymerase